MKCLNCMRRFAVLLSLPLIGLVFSSFAVPVRAANDGQADLDSATQKKLSAQNADDLSDVIKLCESALKKGLDKGNTEFANDLMGSSLTQRGGLAAAKTYHAVLAAGPRILSDDTWRALRSEALDDLEKGVKLSPSQPEALFEIAKLNLLPDGNATRARDALDATISLAKDDANLRAQALMRRALIRNNFADKLDDLNQAVLALPGNAGLLRTRGMLYAENQKWPEALADIDKAIAAEPKQASSYQMKAEVLIKTEKWPEALAALEKAHELEPHNADLLMLKAKILLDRKDYKRVAEELSRALAIDGSNVAILELRAAVYEQIGEKAKALADIDKILEIRPGESNALHMRAALLAQQGKFDEALKALEALHKANPGDSLTMLQIGMLYTNMKKYDKAVETYSAVLADRPDDVDATRGRADAQLNSGHRGDAEADYERALKLKPHDVGLLNNFAWVLATAPEEKLRDGHRALALAIDASRQTEYKQDYILSTLAAAYAETGDFESARKYASQAVELSPSPNSEASRKDELTKELDSYKANKPWREALGESKPEQGKADKDKADKGKTDKADNNGDAPKPDQGKEGNAKAKDTADTDGKKDDSGADKPKADPAKPDEPGIESVKPATKISDTKSAAGT